MDTKTTFAKDPFGNDISWPETDKVEALYEQSMIVLVAIGFFLAADPVSWALEVFLSNESSIGDFMLDPIDVDTLSALLHVPLSNETLIVDIAQARGERIAQELADGVPEIDPDVATEAKIQ